VTGEDEALPETRRRRVALRAEDEGGAMVSAAAEQTPQAFDLQGSPVNTIIFNATVQYVSAVMNDELTMDEAIAKIEEEVAKNAN
jgi:alpha-1,4-digalacturonate transport system substrate-binding protein